MKPKIVILSAFLTPFRSGAEACVEEVALRLADQYDITIVTARLRRDLPKKDLLKGKVPVVRIGIGFGIDKWLFPFLAPFAVRKIKPQVIHAVLESYAGLALWLCRLIVPSARRMLTCQSTNTSLFLGPIHRSAHALTGISNFIVDRAQSFGRKDMILIPNGISLRDAEVAAKHTKRVPGRILFVGRLVQIKGVDTLLRAFAEIHSDNAHLCIVGDGTERFALEHLVTGLGLGDRVQFTGRVSGDALHTAYAEAEIFCGLSRSEALGNVFIEAQAAGCAVVATNVGGIPDTVTDGTTCVLVLPDDVPAAAAALQKLLDDPTLRKRLSEAGQKNAKAYDWDLIAPKYGAIYMSLVL